MLRGFERLQAPAVSTLLSAGDDCHHSRSCRTVTRSVPGVLPAWQAEKKEVSMLAHVNSLNCHCRGINSTPVLLSPLQEH